MHLNACEFRSRRFFKLMWRQFKRNQAANKIYQCIYDGRLTPQQLQTVLQLKDESVESIYHTAHIDGNVVRNISVNSIAVDPEE
jgi:hypothetical protein